MGGVARRNFKMFQKLCGTGAYRNVAIVTTRWDEVDVQIGREREEELVSKPTLFKGVLDGGATYFRYSRTSQSAKKILNHLLDLPPTELLIQTEIVGERKNVPDTLAGLELRKEILKLEEQHKEDMRALQEEMEEAMREHENGAVADLQKELQELRKKMANLSEEKGKLSSTLSLSPALHPPGAIKHASSKAGPSRQPAQPNVPVKSPSSPPSRQPPAQRTGRTGGTPAVRPYTPYSSDEGEDTDPVQTRSESGYDIVSLLMIFLVLLIHFFMSSSAILIILLLFYAIIIYTFMYFVFFCLPIR